ncbi:MAG: hypothetical protein ACJ79H_22580 [Myxococcales bacterium]
MRTLLWIASLSLSASAHGLHERPSAATSSVILVQNGSVDEFDPDVTSARLVADAVDSE